MTPRARHIAAVGLGALLAVGCGTTAPGEPEAAEDGSGDPEVVTQGVAHVQALLRGRVAGVTVVETPRGFAVRIRGTTSVRGSNAPLYVLDGVPQPPDRWGGLAHVSPRDVAEIRVLKDAIALSQWGVRGANGVVVVTTKRAGD